MSRYIFFFLLIFAAPLFAQTGNTHTAYTRPMPFDPFADSYQYTVQKQYESLPIVTNTSNIPGTLQLVKAELHNRLSQSITWKKETPQGTYRKGTNLLPIGKQKIEVRRLRNDYYFWCIYGKIQFFVHKDFYAVANTPVVGKAIDNFFIVLHFMKGNARAHIDYFTVGPAIITNNTATLNDISKTAMYIISQSNKKAYEEIISKYRWIIDDEIQTGKFDTYRNGKVTLTKRDRRTTYDIKRFSLEEQILIRGYIDHQGIPIREVRMQ